MAGKHSVSHSRDGRFVRRDTSNVRILSSPATLADRKAMERLLSSDEKAGKAASKPKG
jgi:hypothetical protein